MLQDKYRITGLMSGSSMDGCDLACCDLSWNGQKWSYKILAAGAIPPKEGFQYAFEHGADFACVGMFDFQVVDNVNTINEVLAGNLERNRSWFA